MIRSTKQYTTTRKRLDDFEKAILEFDVNAPPAGVSPLGHRTALAALQGMRDELVSQLEAFEDLSRRGVEAVRFERLADLPRALVETRIARGMSQKDLADKLEVASQQVQRWEADEYDRTGLAYVLEVGEALNIDEVLRCNRASVQAAVAVTPAPQLQYELERTGSVAPDPARQILEALQRQDSVGWLASAAVMKTGEVGRYVLCHPEPGPGKGLSYGGVSTAQPASSSLKYSFQEQRAYASRLDQGVAA